MYMKNTSVSSPPPLISQIMFGDFSAVWPKTNYYTYMYPNFFFYTV